MLKRNLNRHHPDFKEFKKIINPETVAIIATSLLGKINFTDQEAQEAMQQALNLLIATKTLSIKNWETNNIPILTHRRAFVGAAVL